MNNLYLIVGQSGTGKTSLAEMLERTLNAKQVYSYTTRKPRYDGEAGHIFVSNDQFDALRDKLCAYTRYNDYEYGVTADILDASDVYVINPAGVSYLKERYTGKPIKYIHLTATRAKLTLRMAKRGDSYDAIYGRLVNDLTSFSDEACSNAFDSLDGITIDTDAKDIVAVYREALDYIYRMEVGEDKQ